MDKIGRAFERPRARTGNQHRHLAAFAGYDVRFLGIEEFELILGLGGLFLKRNLERSGLLAARERISEDLVFLLVVGLHREGHDVAVLALSGRRGHISVLGAFERPLARAGNHGRNIAALAPHDAFRRRNGNLVFGSRRIHLVVAVIASSAECERSSCKKKYFRNFHILSFRF